MEEKVIWNIDKLRNWDNNPRSISPEGMERLKKQITKLGQYKPLLITADGTVLGGNMRLRAYRELKMTDIWVSIVEAETEESKIEFALSDNDRAGKYEADDLANLIGNFPTVDWADYSIDITDPTLISSLMDAYAENGEEHGKLTDKFIVPPFSVLDARQGYWQDRKRKWVDMGIQSDEGRDDGLTFEPGEKDTAVRERILSIGTTSTFDPVLCELAYRWFCPLNGTVVDPFAGGSVRGIVASKVGLTYLGVDLSEKQIEENRTQALKICEENKQPVWTVGDSVRIDEHLKGVKADLVFSCPPYADLEVYSDDPHDLSNMDYDSFIMAYRAIIEKSIKLLKDNRFACFVVGDIRDKKGFYRNFVSDTIQAFEDAGAKLYNEAILVTSVGSLPLRAVRQFNSGRKLGKTHQNVLVFYKGNPDTIKGTYGELNFEEVSEQTPQS